MQICASVVCKLLFIAGKNAGLMMVTVLKKKIVSCSSEFALKSVIVLLVCAVVSMELARRHYFWSNLDMSQQVSSRFNTKTCFLLYLCRTDSIH